ncbi:MAG: hypothetical protein UT55_C0057G0004 [Candidatus Peregrinibacteria bacterium GW2011_GWE2_39_6]|nr:MAG: hypothetical protein UT36_C0003G0016 [Candidatus Peregrinibacteria bacterium GW2011_GWF2_39_17]KKR24666.1 MAG: hypothetical protein UT55_C0057G0004 [Candidatus Peregrinibacteria bacterium GW2011_GWE2_39_6]HCW32021.1 hypothetical protein [Candidatus Peregrinibacteria bacterium]
MPTVSIFANKADVEATRKGLVQLLSRRDVPIWVSWNACMPGENAREAYAAAFRANLLVIVISSEMIASTLYDELIREIQNRVARMGAEEVLKQVVFIYLRSAWFESSDYTVFPDSEKAINSYSSARQEELWVTIQKQISQMFQAVPDRPMESQGTSLRDRLMARNADATRGQIGEKEIEDEAAQELEARQIYANAVADLERQAASPHVRIASVELCTINVERETTGVVQVKKPEHLNNLWRLGRHSLPEMLRGLPLKLVELFASDDIVPEITLKYPESESRVWTEAKLIVRVQLR